MMDSDSPQVTSSGAVRLYIGAMTVAALLLFALTVLFGPAVRSAIAMPVPVLVAVLVVAGVVAGRFPLHLTYQTKVDVDAAVLIATALLLDVPTAMAVAAAATVLDVAVGHRDAWRESWDEWLFNTAQTALAVGAGGLFYHLLADSGIPPVLPGLGSLVAVAAGALVIHLVNTLAVATAGALQLGAHPIRSWRANLWLDAPEQSALAVFGVIVAILATDQPWLLPAFVVPVGLVHRSLRRSIDLRAASRAAIEELAEIVDRRDPDKVGHSQRVAAHVARLAERLKLSPPETEIVTAAARVHDVGEVALDPRIVAKAGPLGPADWDEIHRHPETGAHLIERFPNYALGARAVRHHHERWDGTGYPDRLTADAIPLGARLIAVADAFDALTCHRPHRVALSEPAALAELERGASHQWDPRVVAGMVALVRETHPQTAPLSQPAPGRTPAGTVNPSAA